MLYGDGKQYIYQFVWDHHHHDHINIHNAGDWYVLPNYQQQYLIGPRGGVDRQNRYLSNWLPFPIYHGISM
jgi:hypothetical protein